MENKIISLINEFNNLEINELIKLRPNIKNLQKELELINYKLLKNEEKVQKEEDEKLKQKINYISPIYDYLNLDTCETTFSDNLFGFCSIHDIETFVQFSKLLTNKKFTYCYVDGTFTQIGNYYIFKEESYDRCGDHCYNYVIIHSNELYKNKELHSIFLNQKDYFIKQHNKELL